MEDAQELIKQKIYNVLYKKSTVDIVRVLHEDQWPLDELYNLFIEPPLQFVDHALHHQREQMVKEICELIDDIELQSKDSTLEEWKQYKRIRNSIRDKYATPQEKGVR
jgi:hypothetical protein